MHKSKKTNLKPARPKTSAKPQRGAGKRVERSPAQSHASPTSPKEAIRAGSKLDSVITMLCRPKGATIEDLCKATGWQAHSVRGAISGTLKKKLGLTVTSDKTDGERVYRVTG